MRCDAKQYIQEFYRKELWDQAARRARPRRIVQHNVQLKVGTKRESLYLYDDLLGDSEDK